MHNSLLIYDITLQHNCSDFRAGDVLQTLVRDIQPTFARTCTPCMVLLDFLCKASLF